MRTQAFSWDLWRDLMVTMAGSGVAMQSGAPALASPTRADCGGSSASASGRALIRLHAIAARHKLCARLLPPTLVLSSHSWGGASPLHSGAAAAAAAAAAPYFSAGEVSSRSLRLFCAFGSGRVDMGEGAVLERTAALGEVVSLGRNASVRGVWTSEPLCMPDHAHLLSLRVCVPPAAPPPAPARTRAAAAAAAAATAQPPPHSALTALVVFTTEPSATGAPSCTGAAAPPLDALVQACLASGALRPDDLWAGTDGGAPAQPGQDRPESTSPVRSASTARLFPLGAGAGPGLSAALWLLDPQADARAGGVGRAAWAECRRASWVEIACWADVASRAHVAWSLRLSNHRCGGLSRRRLCLGFRVSGLGFRAYFMARVPAAAPAPPPPTDPAGARLSLPTSV